MIPTLIIVFFPKNPNAEALLVNFLLEESHARNFVQLGEVCWHITSQQAIPNQLSHEKKAFLLSIILVD